MDRKAIALQALGEIMIDNRAFFVSLLQARITPMDGSPLREIATKLLDEIDEAGAVPEDTPFGLTPREEILIEITLNSFATDLVIDTYDETFLEDDGSSRGYVEETVSCYFSNLENRFGKFAKEFALKHYDSMLKLEHENVIAESIEENDQERAEWLKRSAIPRNPFREETKDERIAREAMAAIEGEIIFEPGDRDESNG